MRNKPANIYDMLRQAITSQMEMGITEVTLGRGRESKLPLELPPVPPAGRMVSVAEALSSGAAASDSDDPAFGVGPTRFEVPMYDTLEAHRGAICNCQECPLGQTRNKFVYGTGNPDADLLFIGEAPGADEDRQGEPFVGRAGQLLDKILAAIEFKREDVYIANILKCRPPGNRDPQPDEMAKCFPYLREQVRLIKPKLICALGRIAVQALLQTATPLGKLRGRWHEYEGVPLIATYHPAALLRFQAYKKDTWEDMKTLKARYDELTVKG